MASDDEKAKPQIVANAYDRELKEALDDEAWERKAVFRFGPKVLAREDAVGYQFP